MVQSIISTFQLSAGFESTSVSKGIPGRTFYPAQLAVKRLSGCFRSLAASEAPGRRQIPTNSLSDDLMAVIPNRQQ
ncbi:hypothetical protein MAXJ12_30572 [Mesorhizobium alhagi CCNWXJ12-2]|jgi:hypothetical protein|uniref:Uncharacterized protein n=1 Tax=Mesorhizobium alhagi CCNWXJ12-2 TaxID=1107882 RepID=H0I0X7_9HYPH|nr:hypothetical protein MAXJ12_30572 [Mesorhizobium alhagi CCNWXJ12-2]